MKQIVEIKEAHITSLLSLRLKKNTINSSALGWGLQVKRIRDNTFCITNIFPDSLYCMKCLCTWLWAWALVSHSLKLTTTDYHNHYDYYNPLNSMLFPSPVVMNFGELTRVSVLMLCPITYHASYLESLGLGKNIWYWCIQKHLVTCIIHLSCSPYLSNSNCSPFISQNQNLKSISLPLVTALTGWSTIEKLPRLVKNRIDACLVCKVTRELEMSCAVLHHLRNKLVCGIRQEFHRTVKRILPLKLQFFSQDNTLRGTKKTSLTAKVITCD